MSIIGKKRQPCFAFCAFAMQQKDKLLCRIHYNFPMSNGKNDLKYEELFGYGRMVSQQLGEECKK